MSTAPIATVGERRPRLEDERALRGQGHYLDDASIPSMTHGVVVRSDWAHARIVKVDATEARGLPGVLAILTGADQQAAGILPMRPHAPANVRTGEPFPIDPQPILAIDKVRYVGEAVAFVVAESRHQALDAAERILI
ncbi:MAG: xanthine dehydrogenase family protein molybdopterin-binding subunit, partial [Chromatiales bacterium]|nr:xanthine dehydrogenase family protein molybdopterin-binding subunit [Chromatiales bacterium]